MPDNHLLKGWGIKCRTHRYAHVPAFVIRSAYCSQTNPSNFMSLTGAAAAANSQRQSYQAHPRRKPPLFPWISEQVRPPLYVSHESSLLSQGHAALIDDDTSVLWSKRGRSVIIFCLTQGEMGPEVCVVEPIDVGFMLERSVLIFLALIDGLIVGYEVGIYRQEREFWCYSFSFAVLKGRPADVIYVRKRFLMCSLWEENFSCNCFIKGRMEK